MVEIEQVEFDREKEERERQRDREQIELYRQKEEEEKTRDREQIELYRQEEEEEKKRDRQLQNTIFFFGTAIGGGQIFSAAYPLLKDKPIKWQPDFSLPLHPFSATILWSLLFGVGFGLLILASLPLGRKIFPRILPLVRKIFPR
jgi:Na+/glutamate symporter